VTYIGDDAFTNCAEGLVLTAPEDSYAAEYFRENELDYVISAPGQDPSSAPLTSSQEGGDNAFRDMPSGDYTLRVFSDGTADIIRYSGKADALEIPSVLDGNTVKSIAGGAFSGCRLASVTLPDSVTRIGDDAFYNCEKLISVTIPKGVKDIGDSAFSCSGLTSVMLPEGLTSMDNEAFSCCERLISVTFRGGVASISKKAFLFCEKLTSVTLPDGLKDIGEMAFFGCECLSALTIPGSVTSIGEYAFGNCADDLTLTVQKDSYAEQYCRENDIKYRYQDE
jgi:hypothetical protein